MFRRGMAGLAMAGVLLLGIAVPGVLADTTGPGNSDVYSADGYFEGPQMGVSVSVRVGKEDGVAFSNLWVNQSSYQDITCKGKGKKTVPGQIYTNVSGYSEGTAVIKIDKKLGTALASDTLMLTESTFNTCTGKETVGAAFKVSVSMDLHATSGMTSTRSKSETTFPDGHKEIFTGKFDSREAAGDLHFGGTSYAAAFGYLFHDVTTFVIIPAH